jgi:hypothetical protein
VMLVHFSWPEGFDDHNRQRWKQVGLRAPFS